MSKNLQMVREFHEVFGYYSAPEGRTTIPPEVNRVRRVAMIAEEFSETILALLAEDNVEVLDGLVDLSYFALGGLVEQGRSLENLNTQENDLVLGGKWGYIAFTEALKDACSIGVVNLLDPSKDEGLSFLYWTCFRLAESHLGVDFNKAFSEIHMSNMSKLDADGNPVILPSGKIGKSDLYTPPDLLNLFYEELS